jgi:hypothetical protein
LITSAPNAAPARPGRLPSRSVPSHQPSGQKRILPPAQRPVERGRCNQGEQRQPAAAGDPCADRKPQRQRQPLEQNERGKIGQGGQRRADQQERRRIEKILVVDAWRGHLLLDRSVRGRIVCLGSLATIGKPARRIETGKIRRRRLRQMHEGIVRTGYEKREQQHL